MSRRHDPTKLGMNAIKEADAQLTWQESIGGYELNAADGEPIASIVPDRGAWEATVHADGKRYVGIRPSLEEAFKAAARLLFKLRKEVWLKMNSQTVMERWQGDLNL